MIFSGGGCKTLTWSGVMHLHYINMDGYLGQLRHLGSLAR
jgi:hypothetical protein